MCMVSCAGDISTLKKTTTFLHDQKSNVISVWPNVPIRAYLQLLRRHVLYKDASASVIFLTSERTACSRRAFDDDYISL